MESGIKVKIETKSYLIDEDLGTRINKKKFELDSLQIKSKLFEQKISSEINFEESGNSINLDIFFEDDEIMMIRITEESPFFKSYDNAQKVTILYFENGNKIDEKIRAGIPKGLHGVSIPKDSDFDKVFGYNQRLTTEYLMKLSEQIIKQTAE